MAVWSGAAGHRLDHRGDAGLLQVGQHDVVQRVLVRRLVGHDHADLLAVAEAARADPPLHHGRQHRCHVGAGPPQVGRGQVGPVGRGGPGAEQRGLALLGHAELVVALPGADAVDDGEGRRVALGPLPAQRLHVGVVGRVELHDDRVDLAAVDAAGVVDLVHVEVDRRDLLVVLLVLGEALLAGQAVDGDDREDDVDARGGDATGARAGLARRRGGGARRHLGRAGVAPTRPGCPRGPARARRRARRRWR